MLAELGHEASARGVAKLYADFTGTFVIDPADESQRVAIESLDMKVAVIPTVMQTRLDPAGADANVRSWVSADHGEQDADLYRSVMAWLVPT